MPLSKTIVITGASAGIGAEFAYRLARDGHALVLAARRRTELEQVTAKAKSLGARDARPVITDVVEREQVEALGRAAVDAFGGFDVWINNAGQGIDKSVLDLSGDELDTMIA